MKSQRSNALASWLFVLMLVIFADAFKPVRAEIPPGSCFARSRSGNTSWDQYCMAGKGENDIFGLPRLEGWWFKYYQRDRLLGPFVSYVHPRPKYVLDKNGNAGRYLEFRHINRYFKRATAGTISSIQLGDAKTRCRTSGRTSIRQEGYANIESGLYGSEYRLDNLNFTTNQSGDVRCTTSYDEAEITPGMPGEPGRVDNIRNSQIVDCKTNLVLDLNTNRDWSKATSFKGKEKGSYRPIGMWYEAACELKAHSHFAKSEYNYMGRKNRQF